MKNIQIIDGAENCSYSFYQVSEICFNLIFPNDGQDIEFIEDFIERIGEVEAGSVLAPVWKCRIDNTQIMGLHGILFYELQHKKKFYPNKKMSDLDQNFGIGRGR